MNICVFGAASPRIDEHYKKTGEKLGHMMVERGHNLIFGAGKKGMMGAIAKGVKEAGGRVTGIIPKFFLEEDIEPVYEDCDELILTRDMAERKDRMEMMSDSFIITPGGIGTFEEFFQMLVLKQLNRHNKAMAIYNVKGYYFGIEALLHTAAEEEFVCNKALQLYATFQEDEIANMLNYIETDHATRGMTIHELKWS